MILGIRSLVVLMKVKRVFCYSKEVAAQNGNKLPILGLILSFVLFMIVLIVLMALEIKNTELLLTLIIILMMPIMYFTIIISTKMAARITGWTITEDNRLIRASILNFGQGYMARAFANNVTGVIGGTMLINNLNNLANQMSNPDVVAKMVEEAPKGILLIEIVKVHNIIEKKHHLIVKCDYKDSRTTKILYNRNFKVEKSYNQLNELINILNTFKTN